MSDPANRLPPEYDETLPADYDPRFTAAISEQMRVPDRIGVRDSDDSDEEVDMEGYKAYRQNQEQRRVAAMDIPDKIVMLGDEDSAGVRDGRMNLHLDLMSSLPTTNQYVGLDTPPRVLTLDERPFPGYRAGAGDHLRFDRDEEDEDEEEMLVVREHNNKHTATLRNGFITPRKQQTSLTSNLPIPNSVNNIVSFPVKDYIAKWFNLNSQTVTSEEQQTALLATPGEGLLITDDEDDDLMQLKKQVAKLHRHVQRLDSENSSRNLRDLFLYPLVAGYIFLQFMKFIK